MKELITVAKFTMREMVKRKAFLISNLIILLIIVIGFNVPNIMNALKGDDTENEKQAIVWVMDAQNVYQGTLEGLNQLELGSKFEVKNQEISIEEISKKLEEGEITEAIIVKKDQDNVTIEYVVESIGMGKNEQMYEQVFSNLYKNVKMSQSGLTPSQIANINEPIALSVTQTKENSSGAMLFINMMLCIVLFYAIYFCAYQVSSSITTEKTSKIMETLVTSTKPRTIVIGKTLGIGLVGICQVLTIVIVAFISYKLFLPVGMLDGIFDINQITPQFVIITLIYFLLGYILFAFIYALTGSTVSKPEDVQSANSPVAFLAIIGFYLAYFSMMNPASNINNIASMVPISPFSMPFRVIGNSVGIGEILLSLGILVATIAIVANIAIKIYSSAILHYGTKLSIKDLFKMYKEK